MKKTPTKITNPDELNKNLTYNSPITWIVLSLVIIVLAGFFAWSMIYKIQIKLFGKANIIGGEVTLTINDESKIDKLKVGQKVYVSDDEGVISSIDEEIVASEITLADGEYTCYVVINELRPIDFWFNNQ